MFFKELNRKKLQLDKLRPLPSELVKNLDDWFKIELTYTSNAIEGNTLTRSETAIIVEKGLTVGGKTLVEHLEATNHAKAQDWIQKFATSQKQITEKEILRIHKLILKSIQDQYAGYYRNVSVRISGSQVILPNPQKIPILMKDFCEWLQNSQKLHPVELAALAHYKLVTIHPFIDGNGRTARLLMNLILIRAGYPPAIIRKQDRLKYINSLEEAQLGGSQNNFFKLIKKSILRSFDIYLRAILQEEPEDDREEEIYLKIGELAKKTGETVSTIRHWVQFGILEVSDITPAGYQLFSLDVIKQIKKIQSLKFKRYTLSEIKKIINI